MINLVIGVRAIVRAPRVTVESPRNGELRREPLVPVRGRTEARVRLTLNGEQIQAGATGEFQELLPLQRGLNILKLTAKKRYSNTRALELQVIYEPNKELTFITN